VACDDEGLACDLWFGHAGSVMTYGACDRSISMRRDYWSGITGQEFVAYNTGVGFVGGGCEIKPRICLRGCAKLQRGRRSFGGPEQLRLVQAPMVSKSVNTALPKHLTLPLPWWRSLIRQKASLHHPLNGVAQYGRCSADLRYFMTLALPLVAIFDQAEGITASPIK